MMKRSLRTNFSSFKITGSYWRWLECLPPGTPLFDRLKKENRLRLEDVNCNIVPKQMTSAQLKEGYWRLLNRLYAPQAFLERYFKIYQYQEFRRRRIEMLRKANEHRKMRALVYGVILIWNLFWTLFKDGSLKKVGVVYWRNFVEHRRRYQRGVFGFARIRESLRHALALL